MGHWVISGDFFFFKCYDLGPKLRVLLLAEVAQRCVEHKAGVLPPWVTPPWMPAVQGGGNRTVRGHHGENACFGEAARRGGKEKTPGTGTRMRLPPGFPVLVDGVEAGGCFLTWKLGSGTPWAF